MYCNKCGAELTEGAVFCSKCGVKQEALPIPEPAETIKESVSNPSGSIKKGKPIYLIASVALVALVLCVAFICSSLGNKVNLNNYVTVTYDGYNGYGTASINFDEEAFTKKYGNKITMNGDLKVASFFLGSSPSYALFSSAGYSLSKDSDLKNGDTITLTYSSDSTPEEFKKYFGLTVVCKDETLTVADLKEPEKFDAFEKVYVSFSGLSGSGKASIECETGSFSRYNYEISPHKDLKNGDTVTVTLSLDSKELADYAKKYGKVPESLKKSYTVEGLDKYVESVSEISTDSMEQLSALAESEFSKHVHVEGESLENFTVLKYYLLTQDQDTDTYLTAENVLYVICKAKVHNVCHDVENDRHFEQTTDIYYFIETENLILGPDGTLNIKHPRTPTHDLRVGAPFFDLSHTTSWFYPGFSSLEELEDALSSSFTLPWEGYNIEEYFYESTEELETADASDTELSAEDKLAYKKIVERYMNGEICISTGEEAWNYDAGRKDSYFGFFDFNNDGRQELVLTVEFMNEANVYTPDSVTSDYAVGYVTSYDADNNICASYRGIDGSIIFSKFDGKQFVEQEAYLPIIDSDEDGLYTDHYEYRDLEGNTSTITEEEYKKIHDSLNWNYPFAPYLITQENVDKYLG